MLDVEIVLILIGVAFLVGSYFVEEKFSEKDLQEITKMSETQLNIIVEKQVNTARAQVEDSVDEIVDDTLSVTRRGLEKETNEKIMAISEYSDTVLETMNKTHNEIMFLYSMLNDKHAQMTEFAGELQKYTTNTKQESSQQQPIMVEASLSEESSVEKIQNVSAIQLDEDEGMQESIFINKNEQILQLHKEGKRDVEIAKTLDCGIGEVRLVLGLYKEE